MWVNVEESVTKTRDLGRRLPAFLRGLLKVQTGSGYSFKFRITVVKVLWPLNSGKSHSADTLVRVHQKVYKTAMSEGEGMHKQNQNSKKTATRVYVTLMAVNPTLPKIRLVIKMHKQHNNGNRRSLGWQTLRQGVWKYILP